MRITNEKNGITMEEKFNDIKQKAAVLKAGIEELLAKFRTETGYTAEIKVETKTNLVNSAPSIGGSIGVRVPVRLHGSLAQLDRATAF